MKLALIGCGRIAKNHIGAAKEAGFELVALCDLIEERAITYKETFGLENAAIYTDYKTMLKEEEIDLVSIATDSGKHGAIALDCIACGHHVLIEKPITLSLAEADMILALAKEKHVKVSVCHQNRFNLAVQALRKAVEEEQFGKLFYGTATIRWNRGESYYKQAPWRGTWKYDGGALMNQCIHNIDLLLWMMGGQVKSVRAVTRNFNHPYIEAEDFGMAILEFDHGSYGLIEGTTCIYPENLEETLCIFGETGTVKLGGKSVNQIEVWKLKDTLLSNDTIEEQYNEHPENIYGFGHKPLYQDMLHAITTDSPVSITGEDGRRAVEVILGIYQSAITGECVLFPL